MRLYLPIDSHIYFFVATGANLNSIFHKKKIIRTRLSFQLLRVKSISGKSCDMKKTSCAIKPVAYDLIPIIRTAIVIIMDFIA